MSPCVSGTQLPVKYSVAPPFGCGLRVVDNDCITIHFNPSERSQTHTTVEWPGTYTRSCCPCPLRTSSSQVTARSCREPTVELLVADQPTEGLGVNNGCVIVFQNPRRGLILMPPRHLCVIVTKPLVEVSDSCHPWPTIL